MLVFLLKKDGDRLVSILVRESPTCDVSVKNATPIRTHTIWTGLGLALTVSLQEPVVPSESRVRGSGYLVDNP